jgi:hypothetical protein
MRFSVFSLAFVSAFALLSGCSTSDKAIEPSPSIPESFWRFDGSTSFLQVPASGAPNLGAADFTVEAWFKTDTLGIRWDLFDWKDSMGAQGSLRNDLAIYYNGARILAYAAVEDYTKSEVGLTLTGTGVWHHVALARRGNFLDVLLDTTMTSTSYPGKVNPAGPFRIGSNRANSGTSESGASYPFKGVVSDVRIYSRALSLVEFKANQRMASVPPTGLLRRWKLSEATGTVAVEDVGGNNAVAKGVVIHTTNP